VSDEARRRAYRRECQVDPGTNASVSDCVSAVVHNKSNARETTSCLDVCVTFWALVAVLASVRV